MLQHEIKHTRIEVFGRVQGVGFRYSAQNKALQLGITGYVKNQSDGSVYLEVEGPEAMLSEFIQWCQTGPPRAIVRKVDVSEGPVVQFQEFLVR
jgi:acylphosphatase